MRQKTCYRQTEKEGENVGVCFERNGERVSCMSLFNTVAYIGKMDVKLAGSQGLLHNIVQVGTIK